MGHQHNGKGMTLWINYSQPGDSIFAYRADFHYLLPLSVQLKNCNLVLPPDFRGYTLLDTNCLSELVKIYRSKCRAKRDALDKWTLDRAIMIPKPNIWELSRKPGYIWDLREILRDAVAIVQADENALYDTEILFFLGLSAPNNNPLKLGYFDSFLDSVIGDDEEEIAMAVQKQDRQKGPFIEAIQSQRQQRENNSTTVSLVLDQVTHRALQLGYNIPFKDLTWHLSPEHFPAHFLLHELARVHYRNPQTKVKTNDLVDIQTCLRVPYCSRAYLDKSLCHTLREIVGRAFPYPRRAAYELAKRDKDSSDIIKRLHYVSRRDPLTEPLLPHLEIRNINDLQNDIFGADEASR